MNYKEWYLLIEEMAFEWGWKKNTDLSTSTDLVIGIGGEDHGISYSIKTAPKGWLNVHFWYSNTYKSDAVYSLRSTAEVIAFCSLLRDTYLIRSKRRLGK